jgi:hypothetical protein
MNTFARVMLAASLAAYFVVLSIPAQGADARPKNGATKKDINDAVNSAYDKVYGSGNAGVNTANPMARTVTPAPRGKKSDPVPTTNEQNVAGSKTSETPKKGAVPDRFSATYPTYDTRGFQYFTEINDGDGKNTRTELAPLILAPKFAVRVYRIEHIEKVKQTLKDLGAKIINVTGNSPFTGYATMVAEFQLEDQREVLVKLNELARVADDNWGVAPLFYQKARIVAVTGIDLEFAVPVAKNEIVQMLAFYAGVNADDLVLVEGSSAGSWKIRTNPSGPMFSYLRSMQENGKTTQKFDMHLVLLANLLETQQLFSGVTVKRARPVFTYFDGPIEATLSIAWPSDSIGGLRELALTVTVNDPEKAHFDASNPKLQSLGSPAFPLFVTTGMLQDGWVKYAGEKDVEPMASGRWILRDTKTEKFGDKGTRSIHTFVWPFYVFQPEQDWYTGPLTVQYEVLDPSDKKWKPAGIVAEGVPFAVLTHTAREGKVAMPPPSVSPVPKDISGFVSGYTVRPAVNDHWFGGVVAYATTAGVSRGIVGATAISVLLSGVLLVVFGMTGMARKSRELEAAKPKPLAFPTKDEVARKHKDMLPRNDSVDAHISTLTAAHTLIEELLAARVEGLDAGRVTIAAVKEVQSSSNVDAALKKALQLAVALLERTSVIDAPAETLEAEFLKEEFAAVSLGLPKLHELLLALPEKLSEGTGHELEPRRI